jgi:hypothetical protein
MRNELTHRPRRIGAREAARLLSGELTGADRRELMRLLSAAAGPAQPHELVGESRAVAAFIHASRRPAPPAGRAHSGTARFLTRAAAVKLVAGGAALLVGAAALAAETGQLPDGPQQQAHDVFAPFGVPAPRGDTAPSPSPASSLTPGSAPSQTPGAGTVPVDRQALLAPCRSFVDNQKRHRPRPLDSAVLATLVAAAGSQQAIPALCTRVLAGATDDHTGPATSPDGRPSTTPSTGDPGKHDSARRQGGTSAAPDPGGHPHPSPP